MNKLKKFKSAKEIYFPNGKKRLLSLLDALPMENTIPLPVEWAEEFRYMPETITEYYGKFSRETVPHLIEPLNRLHPDDPTTHLALMKSVQSAGTVSVGENGMGFFTKYKLGSCMSLTSTKGVAKIRSSSALDVLIDSGGLAELLKPISKRMKRKTADTTFYKEFSGGIKWLMTSYNSIGDLKSNTFHLIIADEWDEAPIEIADQGDIAGVIEGRTMAARQYKILFISTPSRMETSRIYKSYNEGDQRRFFVPCPICKRSQILVLKGQGKKHGLTFNRKKDERTGSKILDINSVRYICEFCKGEFNEASKHEMLMNGEWVPTWEQSEYTPKSPYHKSYHVQGLISPFLSWERICQQFINTKFGADLMAFKDFTINYMGSPWASQAKSLKWQEIYKKRDSYKPGEVPKGGLQCTGGADVHADRIEVVVVAFGRGGESWIIEKKVFFGSTDSLTNPIWQELYQWTISVRYQIHNKPFGLSLVAIDQGYNPNEKKTLGRTKDYVKKPHIVQEFVAISPHFISVRGVSGEGEIIRAHRIQNSKLKKRYDIAVDVLKEDIFARLERTTGPGSIHFPDFEEENFRQFCSEVFKEIKPKKFGWAKIYERNEVLDCYIYSLAAAYWLQIIQRSDDQWNLYELTITENSN